MIKTKKILMFILILIMAISVSACGGGNGGDSSDTESGDGDSTGAVESLIDWMAGGTFSYDFKMTMEYQGQTSEAEGSMAMDGGSYAINTEMEQDGTTVKARTIIQGGKMYVVDDVNKYIVKMNSVTSDMTGGMPTDYVDMKKTGSGKGEVDGKTLPYDEYTIEGYKVNFYMDGANVYAIESQMEGGKSVMIIKNAKNSVPNGVFDLPEGYTEMSV